MGYTYSRKVAHFARVVPDLIRREKRVKTDESCKLFPVLPGGFILLSRAVRGTEIRKVSSVLKKGGELLHVVRGAETRVGELRGAPGRLLVRGCA